MQFALQNMFQSTRNMFRKAQSHFLQFESCFFGPIFYLFNHFFVVKPVFFTEVKQNISRIKN